MYHIRASRELNQVETILAQKIYASLEKAHLPKFYKEIMFKFINNDHPLCKLSADDSNTRLLISSIIAHVAALHSSIPSKSSPLADYLQNLEECQNNFILTCPSDEVSIVLNALTAEGIADKRSTRYKCQCGYIYIVGNCGNVTEGRECPNCKSMIGGQQYNRPAEGNVRLDDQPVTQGINANNQPGYLVETQKNENHYSVRSMSPTAYRILRIFVHAIIGILHPSQITTKFVNNPGNTNPIMDITQYCLLNINNDWEALKNILACTDEQLTLMIHSILSQMAKNPLQGVATKLKIPAEREEWEKQFSIQYVSPLVKNVMGSATEFRRLLETKSNAQIKIESEINETINIDDTYSKMHLPCMWRVIGMPSMDNFRAYYLNNHEHVRAFPFLEVFLKHEKFLELIQFILPIAKFVQLLSSSLSYRLERQAARELTFRQFITNESKADYSGETQRSWDKAFGRFSEAWNNLIPYVKRYECHELPKELPKMSDNLPVVFGLVEPQDESIFLCAVLYFLAELQNNFLKDVIEIPSGHCQSIKFLESGSKANREYNLQSIRLENIKNEHIIEYENIDDIFLYSQFDLRIGHGQEISYDLFKIEAELAHLLVYEKVFIEPLEKNLYLEQFTYHKEIFQGSMTILNEIKELVPQEHIPEDRKMIFLGNSKNTQGSSSLSGLHDNYEPSGMENPKELLSALEMIICFLKRTSGGDGEMLITDYIEKWMKLTVLKVNTSYKLLTRSGLQIKHTVALYELVEEHVADVVVNCIHPKYQAKINNMIEQEIKDFIYFKDDELKKRNDINWKIPAEAFATALKRFILRHLSGGESIVDIAPLSAYLVDEESLECWPENVSKKIIESKFPNSLLASHTFAAYTFVKNEFETRRLKQHLQNIKTKPTTSTAPNKPPKPKNKGKSTKFDKT